MAPTLKALNFLWAEEPVNRWGRQRGKPGPADIPKAIADRATGAVTSPPLPEGARGAPTTIDPVEELEELTQRIDMENGRIVLDGTAEELLQNEDIKEFYLGLNLSGGRRSYRNVKHYKRRKRWLG